MITEGSETGQPLKYTLRQILTGFLFQTSGRWTDCVRGAWEFSCMERAVSIAHELKLTGVELVAKTESGETEFVAALEVSS